MSRLIADTKAFFQNYVGVQTVIIVHRLLVTLHLIEFTCNHMIHVSPCCGLLQDNMYSTLIELPMYCMQIKYCINRNTQCHLYTIHILYFCRHQIQFATPKNTVYHALIFDLRSGRVAANKKYQIKNK